jgi:phage tail sheath protein FI
LPFSIWRKGRAIPNDEQRKLCIRKEGIQMPVKPTYPGVYVEEIPSGAHPITGVATSIGAFIDYFSRGPLDYAFQIFSFADFERALGGLDINSEASYAIQQFFLNGGTEAYVIRVGDSTVQASAVVLLESPGGTAVATITAGSMFGGTSMSNPGKWGQNLRVEIDYNTVASSDPKQLFNLTITLVDPVSGLPVQTEVFRNLTFKPGTATYAPDVVNQGSQLIQLSPPPGSTSFPDSTTFTEAYIPAETGTIGSGLPLTVGTLPQDGDTFTITATSDGTVPNTHNYNAMMHLGSTALHDYASAVPYLQAAIRSAVPATPISTQLAGVLGPLLTAAVVQLVAPGTATQHIRIVAGRGATTFNPASQLTFADSGGTTTIADLLLTPAGNVQQYQLGITGAAQGAQQSLTGTTGVGKDGGVPGPTGTWATRIIGDPLLKTGMFALENADVFNILCIPAASKLDASPPLTNFGSVISNATEYCGVRRAFLIVDIPSTVRDVATMQTFMSQNDTLRDRNNATYFPRVMIPDPLNNNRLRDVGPSGTLAGLYALTDVNRGAWKAPAGTEASLRNVQQLVYNTTDNENGVLNPLGINCLRSFPVYGNVSWGARTLDGADARASDWKYIPVRRLALFLEESLYRGTKWVVFEPNDEPLWAQIRLNVGAFMHDLFRQGAFQGSTPQKAYLVKCDSETTTPTDQANGIVNIVVGFAPLKPAEFVIIQIQQLAGQLAQ